MRVKDAFVFGRSDDVIWQILKMAIEYTLSYTLKYLQRRALKHWRAIGF
jgi:hypothetical protein